MFDREVMKMPCKDALVEKTLVLKPDQNIEQAVTDMKKSGVTFAPVVENDGTLAGLFSFSRLLENTLPVSVAVGGEGSSMNVTIPSAPGMAKRLQKYRLSSVAEMMQRGLRAVHGDTALDVAVRHVRETGEPAAVVDPDTGAFMGLVTERSFSGG